MLIGEMDRPISRPETYDREMSREALRERRLLISHSSACPGAPARVNSSIARRYNVSSPLCLELDDPTFWVSTSLHRLSGGRLQHIPDPERQVPSTIPQETAAIGGDRVLCDQTLFD